MPRPKYFEDQPPELQARQRMRRREEIAAIGRLNFPIAAEFDGKPVSILGPVARFSPYKEQAKGPEDPFQLMIQPASGPRFITLATCLSVGGLPLVIPLLPLRNRPDFFARLGANPAETSASTSPAPSAAARKRLAA